MIGDMIVDQTLADVRQLPHGGDVCFARVEAAVPPCSQIDAYLLFGVLTRADVVSAGARLETQAALNAAVVVQGDVE